jgi:hypothetical protein
MKIKKSLKTFFLPFLIGFFMKEMVLFINEGGLNNDHGLARSLFGMILSVAMLIFLYFSEEIEKVRDLISEHKDSFLALIKKPRDVTH